MSRPFGHMPGSKAAIQIATQAGVAFVMASAAAYGFKIFVMDKCKDDVAKHYASLENKK